MRRVLLSLGCGIVAATFVVSPVIADGPKGHGLHSALKGAGPRPTPGGSDVGKTMSRMGGGAARTGQGMARANPKMGAQGLGRPSPGVGGKGPGEMGSAGRGPDMAGKARGSSGLANAEQHHQDNAQRILDHRLQQADHLRSNAERNGNEHLNQTADRMEARARGQFDARQQRIDGTPPLTGPEVGGPPMPPPDANDITIPDAGVTAPTPKPAKTGFKGLWPFKR